jgi:hypothetical protein
MRRKLSPSDSCRIGQNIAEGHVLQSAWAEYERPYFCSVSADYLRSNSLAAHILCLAMLLGTLCRAEVAPDLVLHGTVNGKQNHSYIEVPFDVPNHGLPLFSATREKKSTLRLTLGLKTPTVFAVGVVETKTPPPLAAAMRRHHTSQEKSFLASGDC